MLCLSLVLYCMNLGAALIMVMNRESVSESLNLDRIQFEFEFKNLKIKMPFLLGDWLLIN